MVVIGSLWLPIGWFGRIWKRERTVSGTEHQQQQRMRKCALSTCNVVRDETEMVHTPHGYFCDYEHENEYEMVEPIK